jgi:hypothetical protein
LNPWIAHYEVSPKDVPLNSRGHKNPVGVTNHRVFLDDVAGVGGSGQTNTKIASLGRVTISN